MGQGLVAQTMTVLGFEALQCISISAIECFFIADLAELLVLVHSMIPLSAIDWHPGRDARVRLPEASGK